MQWLRPDEAAAALGVSYQNVQVIAHREKWETIRNGKQVFYSLRAIEKYQIRKGKND